MLHERWPATFPSGQGSDFAGVVERLGAGVTAVAERDEVIGWVDTRSSQAEYLVATREDLAPRPSGLPWEVGGRDPGGPRSPPGRMVRAVDVKPGDTVVVSGAAGGVGSLAVQLARRAGATVIGLAGPSNHDWLKRHDVIRSPTATASPTGSGTPGPARVDAFLDTYGGDYVEIALNDLDVRPERIDSVVRFDAVAKYGIKADGNGAGASAATLESWPASSRPRRSSCRSRGPTRWRTSSPPTPSSPRGTSAARSC